MFFIDTLKEKADFYGAPQSAFAFHFYMIPAVAFFLCLWVFMSWDMSILALLPVDAFERPTRQLLYSYWQTPWYYYLTGQFIYQFVERPTVEILAFIQQIIIVVSTLGMLGIVPRLMARIALVCAAHLVGLFLLGNATMDASFVMLIFLLLVLSIAPRENFYLLGRRWTPFELSERYHWPAFQIVFFLVFYYCIAAINKLVDVGPLWASEASLNQYSEVAIQGSMFASGRGTTLWFTDILQNSTLATFLAYFVLIVELITPLMLIFPRLIPLFLISMAGMHFCIYLNHSYGYFVNIATDFLGMPYTLLLLTCPQTQRFIPKAWREKMGIKTAP